MNGIRLQELRDNYERKRHLAVKENEANTEKVREFMQSLTKEEIRVRLNARDEKDINITIDFVGPDGNDDFASDFEISFRGKYDFDTHSYSEPEIASDCSSSGMTTRKEHPLKVARCHLMSAMWNHEEDLVKLLKSLSFFAINQSRDAYQELKDEENRIEKQRIQELNDKIQTELVVGNTFTENYYDHSYNFEKNDYENIYKYTTTYKITKVTPKRVYLEWTWTSDYSSNKYGNVYSTDKEGQTTCEFKFIGEERGKTTNKQSGYIALDKYRRVRRWQLDGDRLYLSQQCKGLTTITNIKYEKESFIPREDLEKIV